jgi:bacillithiol biosynthesis cysteine-adding enzyme BshC
MIFPADKALADLSEPLYQNSLLNWQIIQQLFSDTNKQLEQKNYRTQIQLDREQTLLFYEADDGSRSRIDVENQDYLIKSPLNRQRISGPDLFKKVSQHPERFTPNVALRPVIQDWLLPTVLYVAGPGEISYAAQLKQLYEHLQVIPPIFYPRVRVSLIESKIEKVINKFNVDVAEVFELRDGWLQQKIQRQTDAQFKKIFDDTGRFIKVEMVKIQEVLSHLDPTLESNTQKTSAYMLELLDKLRQKSDAAYLRKMNSDFRQFNKIVTNLFPGGSFQERKVNVLQYIIKYGPDFIKNIFDSIDINDKDHQLIYL